MDPTKCDQAFAYVPDLGSYGIVVYSLAADDSWRVKHNYFHFDPLKGDLNVGGVNFQWTDGVFGLALSDIKQDGYNHIRFKSLQNTNNFQHVSYSIFVSLINFLWCTNFVQVCNCVLCKNCLAKW